MSKFSITIGFETAAALAAFVQSANLGGGTPQAAPPQQPPQAFAPPPQQPPMQAPPMQASPPQQPPQAFAPPPQQPPQAYAPPPQQAPQQAPAAAAPGAWTQQAVLPLMQAYSGTYKAAGVKALFAKYGLPPSLAQLDANGLATMAAAFQAMQPA